MTDVKVLNKITVKDVGFATDKVKEMIALIGKRIIAVAGEVEGSFVKTTYYGDSIGFSGEFVARNLITGETFSSTKIYLPQGFSETLEGKLNKKSDDSTIKFSCEITVGETDKGKGYTFVVTPIQTPEVVQKKAALFKQLEQVPLLEAPKAAKKA